ncbi:MAG: hypothetical protein J5821_03355 [Alphaproteobacteria bacterium]|nr:hypothetical protein [Alphaproteobacteria bacterium]
MAEIIYLKDVLFIRSKSNEKDKKSAVRSRLKPAKAGRILKASLIERKKEDIKTN